MDQFSSNQVGNHASVRIKCPNLSCQRVLAVPDAARGKLVRCRTCGTTIRIPLAKKPPESTAAIDKQG